MISLPRNIIALLVGAGMLLSPISAYAVPCADVFRRQLMWLVLLAL